MDSRRKPCVSPLFFCLQLGLYVSSCSDLSSSTGLPPFMKIMQNERFDIAWVFLRHTFLSTPFGCNYSGAWGGAVRTAPCWTWPIPASSHWPTTGHGRALQPRWQHLWESVCEKGWKSLQAEEEGTESEKEQSARRPDDDDDEDDELHGGADIHTAACGGPYDTSWRNCSPWKGDDTGAGEEYVEEGAAERDQSVLTDYSYHIPLSCPICPGDVELAVKEWSWAREQGEERCWFSVCLFVSHYQMQWLDSYFNQQ